jgi:hypothetical protein
MDIAMAKEHHPHVTMPFKPNYGSRRADRQRAQQEKRDAKEQTCQEKVAKRKAARDSEKP